ncbi:MAG: ATP phosphoribosyltransferase, partial [Hyphomonas sp.]
IVDITSTGATLKANGLKILTDGLILKSEAVFAISPGAAWSAEAKASLGVLFAGAAIKPKELIEKI